MNHITHRTPVFAPRQSFALAVNLLAGLVVGFALLAQTVGATTYNVYGGTKPSWPASWQTVPGLVTSATNSALSGNLSRLDFVGDATYPTAFYAYDASYVYLRVRINSADPAYPNSAWTHNIMVLIDHNNDGVPEHAFSWDTKGGENDHQLELNIPDSGGGNTTSTRWNNVNMNDRDGSNSVKTQPDFNTIAGHTNDGFVRLVGGQTGPRGVNTTTFIDFAVKWSYLTGTYNSAAISSLAPGQAWRVQFASINDGTDHANINADVAGSATLTTTLGSVGAWSDPIYPNNQIYTWTGGASPDANWSNGANWDTGSAPVNGVDLVFPAGPTNKSATNDISGLLLHSMKFTAAGYTNSGNAVSLSAGVTNISGASTAFKCPLTLSAVQTFDLADNFLFTGRLTNNFVLTVLSAAAKTAQFQGIVSGSGVVNKAGSGAVTFSGVNTYTGGTTLSAGTLNLNAHSALGTGTFTVDGGTTLDITQSTFDTFYLFNSSHHWNGDFTFAGTGSGSGGETLNFGTGPVSLHADCQVTVNDQFFDNTLTVGGIISGSGYGLTKAGSGVLRLEGNNTYSGPTIVNAGTLALLGSSSGSGPTTVNAGGTLDLDGSIGADSAVTVASGAQLTTCSVYYRSVSTAAGTVAVHGRLFPRVYPSEPNTLNTGSQTWYGGDDSLDGYVVSIAGDPAGTPGVDWPSLNITGTLDIAATSDHPFAIWPNRYGAFNHSQDYTWRIATASGGVTGFDVRKFIIRTDYIASVWPGLGAGQFILTQSGNDLNLQFFHGIASPVTVHRAFGTYLRLPVATVLAHVSGGTDTYTLTGVTSRNPADYVQISGTNILFAPADPNVPSSILDYFVQSDHGVPAYTNSGTIRVGATNASGVSRSISVSGGSATVSFAGVPGAKYMVQRATDLTPPVDWVNLDGSAGTTDSICTAPAAGTWDFTDPNPPEGQAYYRTVQSYASVIWGGLNQTYDGTPRSVTATSSPSGMTVSVTYDGSSTPPTGAGTYTVIGSISQGSYVRSATNTLTVAKATATVTVTDNGDRTATATTSPPGLTVDLSYSSPEWDPMTTLVTATINEPNYVGEGYGSIAFFINQ